MLTGLPVKGAKGLALNNRTNGALQLAGVGSKSVRTSLSKRLARR